MTAVLERGLHDFVLPPERIATAPIEADGRRRDQTRMLVSRRSDDRLVDAVLADLPSVLAPGDVLVVNTSATLPAALPTTDGRLLHLSTEHPGGLWVVELRRPCEAGSTPFLDAEVGEIVPLPGGARAELMAPYPPGRRGPARLWAAVLHLTEPLARHMAEFGRPIRYGCGGTAWPLAVYQTVFATHPGSAEMPSAARGFTPELVTALVARGVVMAPVTLHCGVSSPDAGEPPLPEPYHVPASTAELVKSARARGHRVVAVGTTVVRALETVVDDAGHVHAGSGWTELVVTPARGVRAVDGILSGWHEPQASHLQPLEAIAGRPTLEACYAHALAQRYRWHELGDVHLVLP